MLEKIYSYSPIFLQNIMISLKGIQFNKQRYNKYYYEELKLLKSGVDEFKLQEERLINFLSYVKKSSPFYAARLPVIDSTFSIKDLEKIDLLEKEDVRKNLESIVTRRNDLIEMSTGGSTGKSLKVYTHPSDISRRIAYLDYFKEKHGVVRGMKRISIGGKVIVPTHQKRKIYWRFNRSLNQLLLSAYHINDDNLPFYIEKMNTFKPESIDGFTTSIHRIAQFIIKNNIDLKFELKAIFPTAEALTDEMRIDIEKAFGCPVRNQYASSEGSPFITENTEGILEINPATGVFELKHLESNIYELVVTSFYTSTTPLVRYKIGDSVELEYPLSEDYTQQEIKIKRIIGRNNDFLVSNERGIVTNVNLSTVVREAGNTIISSQFVQNHLNEVKVNLVVEKDTDLKTLEKKLSKLLQTRFGESTIFHYNYMSEIPKTSQGKTRFTINNL